ncbi:MULTISPECIES: GNAT family N-acetyltransferase [unclassified Streptomyces]|uniref:GNAT family N-acetyltransferase n=1 Tax=unclassified Streptomyces TaxID=2593676 RepID=UPI0037F14DA5
MSPLPPSPSAPSPGAVIRTVAPADLQAVADIYAHYVAHSVATFEETPPSVADWRIRLDDFAGRGLPFLVAEVAGEIAGYAYAGPWRAKPAYRHSVEDTIYLSPDHTGRGLGAVLLPELIAHSARAGMRRMIAVIADTGSDASAALHRRFGFVDAGRLLEVGYKHGRWIDTLLMQCDLSAAPVPPPVRP